MNTYLSLQERIIHKLLHDTNYLTIISITNRKTDDVVMAERNYLKKISIPKERTYL